MEAADPPMTDDTKLLSTLRALTAIVEQHAREPYGPPADDRMRKLAGTACVTLCKGDQDLARTLWKLIAKDLGYMPFAAASALVKAAYPENLVPDVEAPEVT